MLLRIRMHVYNPFCFVNGHPFLVKIYALQDLSKMNGNHAKLFCIFLESESKPAKQFEFCLLKDVFV